MGQWTFAFEPCWAKVRPVFNKVFCQTLSKNLTQKPNSQLLKKTVIWKSTELMTGPKDRPGSCSALTKLHITAPRSSSAALPRRISSQWWHKIQVFSMHIHRNFDVVACMAAFDCILCLVSAKTSWDCSLTKQSKRLNPKRILHLIDMFCIFLFEKGLVFH